MTRLELSGASGAANAVVTISLWNFAGKWPRVHYCDVNAILGRKPLNSWGLNQGPCAEGVLFVNLFLRQGLIMHPWLTWNFLCRPGTHRGPTASLCVSPGSFVQSKHKWSITELHPGLSSWNHLLSESRTFPPNRKHPKTLPKSNQRKLALISGDWKSPHSDGCCHTVIFSVL